MRNSILNHGSRWCRTHMLISLASHYVREPVCLRTLCSTRNWSLRGSSRSWSTGSCLTVGSTCDSPFTGRWNQFGVGVGVEAGAGVFFMHINVIIRGYYLRHIYYPICIILKKKHLNTLKISPSSPSVSWDLIPAYIKYTS